MAVDLSDFDAGLRGLPLPLLYAVGTGIALLALIFLRLISNSLPAKSPPIFEGTPFVGGIIKFIKGPMKLMHDGYTRHGEVFTVPVLHKKFTFLLGPHVSGHFFKANDDEMSQKEVYEFNVPTFGRGVVFDVDHKVRAEQFRFFAEALKSAKLKVYVPYFVQEAQDYFSKWGQEGTIDFGKTFSELIILTASRTLMGREVRESMFHQVADLFHDLDMGMLPISVLFPYLPIPAHWARDRARAELSRIFARIIQARRASQEREEDILQSFIDSRYEKVYGGRYLNDEEITGMLIATLFAGQHTSSITSSWTGLTMIRDQATFQAAVEEQRQVIAKHGHELSMEALNDMKVLERVMMEALRLFPPLIMLLRLAKAPFAVTTSKGKTHVIPKGHVVATSSAYSHRLPHVFSHPDDFDPEPFAAPKEEDKGHVVATSPAYSHRLPHVFSRPDDFDPERFAAPREEDKAAPFSFIGFGGGRHGCMGSNFAILQIKSIWSVLLRGFEFELVDPFPEPDFESMVVGPKPCRVHYKRRKQPL